MTTTSNSQSVVRPRTPKAEQKKTAPAKARGDQHVEEQAMLTQSKEHPQRAASNFATHEHNERWPDHGEEEGEDEDPASYSKTLFSRS